MKCIEQKSKMEFFAENINEIEEQKTFFSKHKEFSKKFGEPDIKIFLTIKETENFLNKEVEKILDEYDYDNIGDVKVYADDKTSSFYEEAKQILEWYKALWDWFYEFIDGKEEVDYDELIKNYPKFKGA